MFAGFLRLELNCEIEIEIERRGEGVVSGNGYPYIQIHRHIAVISVVFQAQRLPVSGRGWLVQGGRPCDFRRARRWEA